MGLMRFTVSPPDRITEETIEQAYLSGMDRIPWPVRVRREDEQLVLERAVSESANLHLPWDVAEHGRIVLSTATLSESPHPYQLPLELARGKVGQLRNQMAEWQSIGLTLPDAMQSHRGRGDSIVSRGRRSCRTSRWNRPPWPSKPSVWRWTRPTSW